MNFVNGSEMLLHLHTKGGNSNGSKGKAGKPAAVLTTALAVVRDFSGTGIGDYTTVQVRPDGRHIDRLPELQPDQGNCREPMGRRIPLQEVFVITGFYAVSGEHSKAQCLRTAVGISFSDYSGDLSESDKEQGYQEEGTDHPLHAELRIGNRTLWYGENPSVGDRTGERTFSLEHQLHDYT